MFPSEKFTISIEHSKTFSENTNLHSVTETDRNNVIIIYTIEVDLHVYINVGYYIMSMTNLLLDMTYS